MEENGNDGFMKAASSGQQLTPKKIKGKGCLTALGIFIALLIVIAIIGSMGSDDKETKKETSEVSKTQDDLSEKEVTDTDDAEEDNKVDWIKKYKSDGKEIKYLEQKYLFKHGKDYVGKIVVTTSKVSEIDDSTIKCDTGKDDNFFFDFIMNFKDDSEIKDVKEGKKVTVIGKVNDKATVGGSVTINNCHLVAYDKETKKYNSKLKKSDSDLKKEKVKKKEKAKKKAKNSKQKYKNSCKSYNYKSILRNPNKYKGKKIKVTGKVIQAEEFSLFGISTVTLRVEDSNGNDWYIDYEYSDGESKVIEDDKVTIYGESTGSEKYTTVLGSTRTVPSIDAKYIDIK